MQPQKQLMRFIDKISFYNIYKKHENAFISFDEYLKQNLVLFLKFEKQN